MATRAGTRSMPATYFELIRQFPLTIIRDGDHLAEAQVVVDGLLKQDLDEGGQAYLDVLSGLVETYEDAHVPILDATESAVLRALMTANGLSQTALRGRSGSRS